jgi:cytochrome P450
MRVHPGVGLILERVVPKGGMSLPDGRFVPEGVTVGMNPWVINKDESVFGEKTDEFIPERWLQSPGESDEVYQVRFSKMKSTDFTFGAGSRACLGRYLSQLESFKLIATLFSTFNVS